MTCPIDSPDATLVPDPDRMPRHVDRDRLRAAPIEGRLTAVRDLLRLTSW